MSSEIKWYDFPQKIKIWSADIDYVMFIDENGSAGKITDIFKKITNNLPIDENDKYFTITGCIFERKDYYNAQLEIKKLKEKFWDKGIYYDSKAKKEKYVCLHSREIRRHDGAFNDKLINHDKFTKALTNTLKNINCTIISININLVEYLKKGYLHNVYETAFDFILERYIYATKNNKKGIIMLEARGKLEDKALLKHINDVINNRGRKNITTKELKEKIKGVYFNPKWNEEYSATYVGLEIADLFSYPIHQAVKYKKDNQAFLVLKEKLDGYPNFLNKGIKIFPKEKDDINHP